MLSQEVIDFSKVLAGKFSNKKQSSQNARLFDHINTFFVPIDWKILNGPGFYCEQSKDYSPWTPYRQSINKVLIKDNGIIVFKCYGLNNSHRIAGAGSHPELLSEIQTNQIIERKGCDMYFKQVGAEHFLGNVEPGGRCLIKNKGKKTFLTSKVEINRNILISLDQGIDSNTGEIIWGSKNGPLLFDKVESYQDRIKQNWSN